MFYKATFIMMDGDFHSKPYLRGHLPSGELHGDRDNVLFILEFPAPQTAHLVMYQL